MARNETVSNAPVNRLLAKIAADELAFLRPHLETVRLDVGTPLIKPRQPIRDGFFPTTGLASLVTVLEDGSTIEAGSVGREGMVGIPIVLGLETTPMQTIVQIAGEFLRVKAQVVKDLFAQRRTFYQLVNRYVHTLFVIASQSAACNRRHQLSERLARWLLMSSDGIGSDEVGLTHEYLAAMLGVRRSGVTEAAQKLQGEGLIEYKRGGVRILDRKRLTAAACECYGLVKSELDKLLA